MTNLYNLTVRTENHVPPDVLVEHIAVCLKSLNFTGKVDITMNSATRFAVIDERRHPFDGPEVFDDSPQLEEYDGPRPEYANGGYVSGVGPLAGELHRGDYIIPKRVIDNAFPNLLAFLDRRGKDERQS